MKFRYYLLVVLVSVIANVLLAQTKNTFTQISKSLPSTEVYDLFVDSKGFLWIGHSQGISRFDGTKYITYTHPLQNNMSLSNICEDGNGTIWTNNFGAQVFYIENNQLKLLDSYDWRAQQNFPTILPYKNDYIVASHNQGLFVYNIHNKTSTVVKTPDGKGFDHPNILLYKNEVFIARDTSWLILRNNAFEKINPMFTGKRANYFTKYLGRINDTVYLQMLDNKTIGAITIDINKNNYIVHRTFQSELENYRIASINPQQSWLFTNKKSILLGAGLDILKGKKASDIVVDNINNIWISSLDSGIHVVPSTSFPYQKTQVWEDGHRDALNALTVYKNQVWAASNGGVIYTLQGKKLVAKVKNKTATAFQSIQTVANQLFVGSISVYNFNDDLNSLELIANTSSVKCIAAADNKIWIGDPYGLLEVGKNKANKTIRAKRCKAITYQQDSKTMYGVFIDGVFSIKQRTIRELTYKNKAVFGTSICQLNNNIYVGTITNGVLVYKNGLLQYQIGTQNGLPSNTVLKVKQYGNSVWILTPNGLEEWNAKANKLVHHGTSVPFSQTIMKDFAIIENTAYVTDGQWLYHYTLNQKRNNYKLTTFIDDVFANGIKIDTAETTGFNLPNGTNNIQFLLSAVSSSSIEYAFKYRMVGENAQWITVPATQYGVNFPTISPGKYTFEVMAVATDGTESKPVMVVFTIALGWWQNWWLWLAVASLVFLIIAIIVALRIENINQKNKLIIEKMNLQAHARDGMLAAIRSQMNPHFIFNALNTIQSYIYTNDEDKANSYLGKFSDLIRQILDASQLTHIPLSGEISMLQLYLDLELMRFENTLHAVITVDPSVPTDQIEIPPMMVQPYVENAIKHGLLHKPADRQLSINISMQHDYLQIAIFDNGVGRVKSQQINSQRPKSHQSFATKANQNRLELLNQNRSRKIELSITDHVNHLGVGTGTTVLLKLPL